MLSSSVLHATSADWAASAPASSAKPSCASMPRKASVVLMPARCKQSSDGLFVAVCRMTQSAAAAMQAGTTMRTASSERVWFSDSAVAAKCSAMRLSTSSIVRCSSYFIGERQRHAASPGRSTGTGTGSSCAKVYSMRESFRKRVLWTECAWTASAVHSQSQWRTAATVSSRVATAAGRARRSISL